MEKTVLPIVEVPNREMEQEAEKHVNRLTKPTKSLGQLEEIAIRLAGITGTVTPSLDQKTIAIFCGDHGIVEEGVSAYPQEITGLMLHNFVRGGAAINVLARQAGADVVVVDVGSKLDEVPEEIIARKVKKGTNNFLREPAMSRKEALQAIEVGIETASMLKESGTKLIAVGEMGIGNTTPATAVTAALTGKPVHRLTGIGTGLTEEGLERKVAVIEQALHLHQPEANDPIDVLAKVGGLEIAAMAGCFLGASAERIPVLVDGVISTAAALVAVRLEPNVREYLFASHLSMEPAHRILLDEMGLEPMLTMSMRLGEASGAALAFPIFEAAVAVVREMATFADLGLPNPE